MHDRDGYAAQDVGAAPERAPTVKASGTLDALKRTRAIYSGPPRTTAITQFYTPCCCKSFELAHATDHSIP